MRARLGQTVVFVLFALAGGCRHDPPADDTDPPADTDLGPTPWLLRIDTAADYEALTTPDGEVKFLLQSAGGALPGPFAADPCVFSNSVLYPYHLQFLRSLPGLSGLTNLEYTQATAHLDDRVYAPGSLYWFPDAQHPGGELGVLAYTLSVLSDEAPDTVPGWADVDTRLGGCLGFPGTDVVLVGVDPGQEAWLLEHTAELAAAGVTVMPRAALTTAAIDTYSAGETYGYVNLLPPGQRPLDVGPRDLVIADVADDELSVIAGLITTFPQSTGSHLNLRMREKGLPNLRWAAVRESATVAALDGALVHLVVTEAGALTLTRATLSEAEPFWAAQQPPLPPPVFDLTPTDFRVMADLSHADGEAYGTKAANLGEIFDALPAPNRPDGFGIPFSVYDEHVRLNGIDATIDALLADPQVATDRLVRIDRLEALQDEIRRAPLAPGLLDRLATQLRASFGSDADTTYIRFRSSTNAEDLVAFSGAGLYDSKTGCLADDLDADTTGPSRCLSEPHRLALEAQRAAWAGELAVHPDHTWLVALLDDLDGDLADEKPVADALRKVWRSLWNVRAYEERTWYGLDHRRVFMGVAVVPTMVMERQETVAFTNLDSGTPGAGLYRVLTQLGEIGVVRPAIPTAEPEELTFARVGDDATSFTVVRRSSESPGADLWSTADRQALSAQLMQLHDHFAAHVYPDLDPLRLDVELDVNADGIPVFKQARPYLGE